MEKNQIKSDAIFTAQDIIWGLKNWKLESLTAEERLTVLNFIINDDGVESNEYRYGENDIESFILEIISA